MWNSKCSEWDCVDKGPKRDISGELKKAIQAQGMKFVMTLHHAGAWNYYTEAYKYDAADPKYVGLYTEPHKFRAPATEKFLDLWFTKVKEVVDGYSPDLLWFDACMGGVVPLEHRQKMAAYCYNKADD